MDQQITETPTDLEDLTVDVEDPLAKQVLDAAKNRRAELLLYRRRPRSPKVFNQQGLWVPRRPAAKPCSRRAMPLRSTGITQAPFRRFGPHV